MATLPTRGGNLLARAGKLLSSCACCCRCNAANMVNSDTRWCCNPPSEIYATVTFDSSTRTRQIPVGFGGSAYQIDLQLTFATFSYPVTLVRQESFYGCEIWSSLASEWSSFPSLSLTMSQNQFVSLAATFYHSNNGAKYKRTGSPVELRGEEFSDFRQSYSAVINPPSAGAGKLPCERLDSLGQVSLGNAQIFARNSSNFNYWNDSLLPGSWSQSFNATIAFSY
jgi:hypothetical protein